MKQGGRYENMEEKEEKTVRLIPAERHTRKLHVAAYIRVSSKITSQDESYESPDTLRKGCSL